MKRPLVLMLSKLLLILVIPVLILGSLGYVSIFVSKRYVTEQVDRLVETTLYQIEQVSQQLLDDASASAISIGTAQTVIRTLQSRLDQKEVDPQGLRELNLIRNLVNTSAYARDHIHSIYIYLKGIDAVLTTNFDIQSVNEMVDKMWLEEYRAQSESEISWTSRREVALLGDDGPKEILISVNQRLYTLPGREIEGVVVLNIREEAIIRLVENVTLSKDQRFIIKNKWGDLIVTNLDKQAESLPDTIQYNDETDYLHINNMKYLISHRTSMDTNWSFILLTPESVYFESVRQMVRLTIFILTVALLLGLIIVFITAKRSFQYIQEIVELIDRSEASLELPSIQEHSTSGFNYFTYHILRAFVERQVFQLQLSERILREKNLELMTLQSQLNPHFLFNTLDALNWQILSETGSPGVANEMVGSLADMLKYALQGSTRRVTMEDELRNVESYVNLQSLRQGCEYSIVISISEELKGASMIPLTLQPLVENSIIHGFKGRKSGQISIFITKGTGTLNLRIKDDGCGIDSMKLEALRKEIAAPEEYGGEHIGLVQTIRRLRLAFDMQVSVLIDSSTRDGFDIHIGFPLRFVNIR